MAAVAIETSLLGGGGCWFVAEPSAKVCRRVRRIAPGPSTKGQQN